MHADLIFDSSPGDKGDPFRKNKVEFFIGMLQAFIWAINHLCTLCVVTLSLGWVFLFYELLQLVLFCYVYLYYNNETKCTEVVDGSNESLHHADEEMHPLVRTFSPSQTIFQNLDVNSFFKNCLTCVKVQFLQQESKQTFPENLKYKMCLLFPT